MRKRRFLSLMSQFNGLRLKLGVIDVKTWEFLYIYLLKFSFLANIWALTIYTSFEKVSQWSSRGSRSDLHDD